MHDEKKLPKWARQRLADERQRVADLKREMNRIKQAHAVLSDTSGWFTIPGPPREAVNGRNIYRLYYLSSEGAHAACDLRPGDRLLIGRAK